MHSEARIFWLRDEELNRGLRSGVNEDSRRVFVGEIVADRNGFGQRTGVPPQHVAHRSRIPPDGSCQPIDRRYFCGSRWDVRGDDANGRTGNVPHEWSAMTVGNDAARGGDDFGSASVSRCRGGEHPRTEHLEVKGLGKEDDASSREDEKCCMNAPRTRRTTEVFRGSVGGERSRSNVNGVKWAGGHGGPRGNGKDAT